MNEPLRASEAAGLAEALGYLLTRLGATLDGPPSESRQRIAELLAGESYALFTELGESPLMEYLRRWHRDNFPYPTDADRAAAAGSASRVAFAFLGLAERLGSDPELAGYAGGAIAAIARRAYADLVDLLGEDLAAEPWTSPTPSLN